MYINKIRIPLSDSPTATVTDLDLRNIDSLS